ncbi:hypothetical protein KR52_10130 [Synechococcus sp. KORDI-52]|uniref:hypothetical protein n=1 Tax=Synechococcus sp. KORDI-52 TaxID=585425 RepID=UPI0004E04FF7|nr:hypothetical protein [Synechococcus sp. KORDI-52]AII49498.1 hypothetical protein KR52_10130 [Synechococcus sp. KORDI-52]
MVFNSNKGFFLTLDDSAAPATLELTQQEAPATEKAPVEEAVVTANAGATPIAPSEPSAVAKPSDSAAVAEAKAESSSRPTASLTTAEAIAAELAEAEAARPAVTYSTFAPSNLTPGGGLRQRSRRPGAALKSFRGIAQDLFKS